MNLSGWTNLTYQGFFSPAQPGALIWGVGPAIEFPTASPEQLGADRYSAGPSILLLTMPGKWVVGVLVQNIWDFAGEGDESVNRLTLQPIINYNLVNGWYLTSVPIMTANWEADEAWTVPLGGGAGKLQRFGKLPVDFKAAYYYNVVRPEKSPWFGDLDAMIEREAVRVLVPMSKTFYFLDGVDQHGISYEGAKMFEEQINDKLERGHLKVHVIMIPVAREELFEGLIEGYGDIALGNLTITPERRERVDFSDPFMSDVKELVVTGPNSPELPSIDDLSGKEIMVRESSSYYDSLQQLNARFRSEGRDEIELTLAAEVLEDEDLLEMVNAGLIPIVVVDSHKAQFWAQIFPDVRVHEDLAVASGGEIGWAFRKNSPQLEAAINEFVVDHKKGTLLGNMAFNRYLRDTKWAERALNNEGRARLQSLIDIFRRYGEQYDIPWLLVAAQGYQESHLDQSVRSPAGAIGVMQLLPSTAADPNVGISNIEEVENNIHAGTKNLRFVHDRYFADAPDMTELNKGLFSGGLASSPDSRYIPSIPT